MTPEAKKNYPINAHQLLADGSSLAGDPRVQDFSRAVGAASSFSSAPTFNAVARSIIDAWRMAFPVPVGTLDHYPSILNAITEGTPGPAGLKPIATPWGGVHITKHEPPTIEKFLALKAGGYLHFETHDQKQETLEVREGAGILIYRETAGRPLRMLILTPGVTVSFQPGQEHTIIGTEELLVFERSRDPKGMDQDLIFIYEAENLNTSQTKR